MPMFKLAALASLFAGSAALAEEPAMFLTADDMQAAPGLCEAGEDEVFYGQSTADEFGYSIAVCVEERGEVADDRISVVLSGEGGNLRTSCLASQCGGVIDYERYTRYRFTLLTLTWRTEAGTHRIDQVFDAEDLDAEPVEQTTHNWPGDEGDGELLMLKEKPVSLMALEASGLGW